MPQQTYNIHRLMAHIAISRAKTLYNFEVSYEDSRRLIRYLADNGQYYFRDLNGYEVSLIKDLYDEILEDVITEG